MKKRKNQCQKLFQLYLLRRVVQHLMNILFSLAYLLVIETYEVLGTRNKFALRNSNKTLHFLKQTFIQQFLLIFILLSGIWYKKNEDNRGWIRIS